MDDGYPPAVQGERWWASDRRYFSLAARPEPLHGGLLFVSSPFADLPPGFVASVPDAAAVDDPAAWAADLTARATTAGARLLRAYLPDEPTPLADCLRRLGFGARPEVGLALAPTNPLPPGPDDEVVPVESERDWAEELALQRTVERAWSDVDVDRWLALERAQCDGGATRYLIRHHGIPVASFGRVDGDPLRRPKSLVVHRYHRGRGHAATAFRWASEPGDDRPLAAIAVDGGRGHRSYLRLGLQESFRFVEWSRAA